MQIYCVCAYVCEREREGVSVWARKRVSERESERERERVGEKASE